MRFIETALKGVILVEPDVFEDPRGFFLETYHARKYADGGIPGPFVQDNWSRSVRGTIRGLHYQFPNAQGKLIAVVEGEAFDVAVDIRRGSPTFGQWDAFELTPENRRAVFLPEGVAHGFCVTSESAGVTYKVTNFYSAKDERGIIWNDPTLRIPWPVSDPIISKKDQSYKALAEMSDQLPGYGG